MLHINCKCNMTGRICSIQNCYVVYLEHYIKRTGKQCALDLNKSDNIDKYVSADNKNDIY